MAKHGDIDENTGLVFWCKSEGRERWFDPARFFFLKNRQSVTSKIRYWKNPESARSKLRDWHHKNRDKKSKAFSSWRMRNLEKIREYNLKKNYGITKERYLEMWVAQDKKCAICGSEHSAIRKTGTIHNLCVDHCHKTGKVRGLLCVKCNAGIGNFKDNPQSLIAAAEYVKKHQ